jgi:chromosome partitioning protein
MGKVLAVLNQKGGAHKTTVATNFAYEAARNGESVLLVDTNMAQRSASAWHENGEAKPLIDLVAMDNGIDKAIFALKDRYDWVIIDGSPSVNRLSAQAIKVADIVLIPVQPSPYDIWACEDVAELVLERQTVTNGKPIAGFLASGCRAGGVLTREINEALSESGLPLFSSKTTFLDDYKMSGLGVGVTAKSVDNKASFEIRKLFKEVKKLLSEGV